MQQAQRYADFYGHARSLRQLLRFDIRYRSRRFHEVVAELDLELEGKHVLDVGFGWGQVLASLPSSCHIVGADISRSGVEAARTDPRFARFASARFEQVEEDVPESLPAGPFDLIYSSHTLEHVRDDAAYLAAFRERLRPGGHLVIFVPIEEPDYITYHVRNYSLQSISNTIARAGFELCLTEGSMYVNGHVWKLWTIPSRRHWPVVKPIVDSVRLASLSSIPYRTLRRLDGVLYRLGFGARQALVVARRPER